MSALRLDLSFPHNYEVELEPELPPASGAGSQFYYPGALDVGGGGGLILRVSPARGEPWYGTFSGGYESPRAVSGVYSCANPDQLCVISQGSGYLVRAAAPREWEEISLFPIRTVRPVLQAGLLVFAGFTSFAALGRNGMAWQTPQLSWDGIEALEVSAEGILGLGWDAPNQRKIPFRVDLRTGKVEGGASPGAGGVPRGAH